MSAQTTYHLYVQDRLINDPEWWPHRYDTAADKIHFIRATRDDHRSATFLTDEYLSGHSSPEAIPRREALSTLKPHPKEPRFVFHSGYCCSTLLARAFDIPGISMGYKEPTILNDLVGWRARTHDKTELRTVTRDVLRLLSTGFEMGETAVIKPSCLINAMATDLLTVSPNSTAVFLYAPLKDFVISIARKGLWGRLWVRELMSKQIRDDMIDMGFEGSDYLKLTDLQTAVVVWLTQQALFSQLKQGEHSDRIITMSSERLINSAEASLQDIARHFDIDIDPSTVLQITSGPIFKQHSKTQERFDVNTRTSNKSDGYSLHADEVDKVYEWGKIVARNNHIPLTLD